MNLAEFPLTVLSTRLDPDVKTLEFSDTIYNKKGKPVQRRWIITGADKFGLPTSSDDEVLLGLLKLTVDSGFESRKIFFTRYELLKILRWTTEGRSYRRLQNALDRLSGVRIKATNAFFDNEAKTHSTRNFGIIDAYEINNGREVTNKPSFFIWSEVLFKSFQVGFIKKLDLDFFLGLSSAVTRRLYRYLDKHFWYKASWKMNLFTLAHEKIGVSRNYRYPSSIRQQLDPAVEELIERGFLTNCEYVGKGKNTEIVFYAAKGKPRAVSQRSSQETKKSPEGANSLSSRSSTTSVNSAGADLKVSLLEALIERGIHERQAEKLLRERGKEELVRIKNIVAHYDQLTASNSHLISKSPQGFLYRAVERPEHFVLPGESPQTAMAFKDTTSRSKPASKRFKPRSSGGETSKSNYLVARRRELDKLKGEVEPELIPRIREEVEAALGKIRGMISEENFKEAVNHAVDEKLAKLFSLPDYEEWQKNNNK